MSDLPFYLTGTGDFILEKQDLLKFKELNPELASHIDTFEIKTRIIKMHVFEAYCRWIIGQQLSVRVAETITSRFLDKVNPLTTSKLLATPDEELRKIGLSRSKVQYVKNVARFVDENKNHPIIKNPKKYTSEEIRNFMMQIKGVGPWTVNMDLIFSHGRKDIFAPGDLVVRKGIQILYNLRELPSEKECKTLYKEKWGNIATVGTMLAWRALGE